MNLSKDVLEALRPGGPAQGTALRGERFGYARDDARVLRVPGPASEGNSVGNMVGQLWAAMAGRRLLGWVVPDGTRFRVFALPAAQPVDELLTVQGAELTRVYPSLDGALAVLAMHANRILPPEAGALARALVLDVLADGKARTRSELILAVYPSQSVSPELLEVVDEHVSAAIDALTSSGEIREVVVTDPDGASGDVWFARVPASGTEGPQ